MTTLGVMSMISQWAFTYGDFDEFPIESKQPSTQ